MTSSVPEPLPSSFFPEPPPPYDVVVLAAASSRRLSGRDKAEVVVDGRRLIDRAVEAASGAGRIVIVGPRRQVAGAVEWTREAPPGGGPAAALQAGMRCVGAELVVVLAVDLPFVDAPLVSRLVGELSLNLAGPALIEGVILCDTNGRDQPLAGAYLSHRLRTILEPDRPVAGVPLKRVLGSLRLMRVSEAEATFDCDTWADVEAAEAKLRSRR